MCYSLNAFCENYTIKVGDVMPIYCTRSAPMGYLNRIIPELVNGSDGSYITIHSFGTQLYYNVTAKGAKSNIQVKVRYYYTYTGAYDHRTHEDYGEYYDNITVVDSNDPVELGEHFSASTSEGFQLRFKVIDPNSCIVENDDGQSAAMNNLESGEVTIPRKVRGYTVVGIGDYAFDYCYRLTNVIIPSSVGYIGKYAFSECSQITSISLPTSLDSICDGAFDGCSRLANISLPSSLKTIGNSAFSGCDFTKVAIPSGVESIGKYTFSGCTHLSVVEIPASVKSIGNNAFAKCKSLSSISIPKGTIIIGDNAFSDCTNLTTVTIHEDVVTIGNSPFSGCNKLKTIDVLSGNVNYSSLEGVLFDKNKSVLIQYPAGNNSSSYVVPSSVTELSAGSFRGCKSLRSISLSGYIKQIGEETFRDCTYLTNINVPTGVKTISDAMFYGCKNLSSVSLPNNLDSICTNAFYGCTSLTSIEIDARYLGLDSFRECTSLKNVNLSNRVTKMAATVFYNCESIESIILPQSIEIMGQSVFMGCKTLKEIKICKTDPSKIKDLNPFFDVKGDKSIYSRATLYVPKGSLEKYKKSTTWGLFTNIKEFEFEVEKSSGDLNSDGSVNGTDIVLLTNMILGKTSKTSAADVNGDGVVNGTDIVKLVNIILNK